MGKILSEALKMEVLRSSETSMTIYKSIRRHSPRLQSITAVKISNLR